MSWDEGIDGEEVLDIITSNEEELCVIAGPGTGKTFALKRRVQRLIEEGKDPSRMLVVTFSRTAAADIKKELAELGVHGIEKVTAKTLHSYCFSLLNKEGVLEITGRNTRTLMDFEKRFMLEDLKNLGLGSIQKLENKLLEFEAAWAKLQSDEPGWPFTEEDQIFEKEMHNWLLFHEAMIVEEIIPEAYKYLRDNPRSNEIKKFDYIFVDEYQDLNKAEQKLIELLANNAAVMIIGDDDQSIYSFRHAHPEGIYDYSSGLPEEHKSLNKCRRCPENVIDIANDLIKNNDLRYFPKQLKPISKNSNGNTLIVQWDSIDEEIEGIVRYIKNVIDAGIIDISEILVLSPRRLVGYEIRDRLIDELDISARSFFQEQELEGSPKKAEKCEHQKSFTLLTLLADLNDKVALRCGLGFANSNLRAPSYKKLLDYCSSNNESPKNVLDRVVDGNLMISGIKPLIEPYNVLKTELDYIKSLNFSQLVDVLFSEDKIWATPFRSVLEDMDSNPSDILKELKNNIIQYELPSEADYVRIMSLHKSKGLTAGLVIICSCVNGVIPSPDPKLSYKDQKRLLEEQRRLFYVGITRTTNILVISSFRFLPVKIARKMMPKVPITRRWGNMMTRSSQFISELGPNAPKTISGSKIAPK